MTLDGPKSRLVYRLVQNTTLKKTDNRQAKQKDMESDEVSDSKKSGQKSMVIVASSSGTKIPTLNQFDVLNMEEKDVGVTPSELVN